MTERAQPGAQGSTMRNIEIGEATGSITDGFIVPSSDPTFSAQRWDNLNEGQFDEFDASYSSSSLTVTIQPGEAFVKGWLATDESHDVALESFEDGQEIRLGWDADSVYSDDIHTTREEADRVLIRHEQNWPDNMPYIPIWEFDTDGDGVTGAIDRRKTKPDASFNSVNAEEVVSKSTPRIIEEFDGEDEIFELDLPESYRVHIQLDRYAPDSTGEDFMCQFYDDDWFDDNYYSVEAISSGGSDDSENAGGEENILLAPNMRGANSQNDMEIRVVEVSGTRRLRMHWSGAYNGGNSAASVTRHQGAYKSRSNVTPSKMRFFGWDGDERTNLSEIEGRVIVWPGDAL